MSRWTGPKILTTVAVFTMVAAAVACFVTIMLNAFVFDDYDEYGEIAIPGSESLQLPAGEVKVTFHTVLIGRSGSGLPVPPLKYSIKGPDGVDVEMTEDYGSTTTVNNDARVRIGYLHLAAKGTYDINLDGNVSAYLNPTLAFGKDSSFGTVPWILAAVFAFGAVDLVVARIWAARTRRTMPSSGYQQSPTVSWQPATSYPPSVEGIRIEQLNHLARLRESGALTEEEYATEKKRVLDGL